MSVKSQSSEISIKTAQMIENSGIKSHSQPATSWRRIMKTRKMLNLSVAIAVFFLSACMATPHYEKPGLYGRTGYYSHTGFFGGVGASFGSQPSFYGNQRYFGRRINSNGGHVHVDSGHHGEKHKVMINGQRGGGHKGNPQR